jgi:hypothetical protein
MEAGVEVFRRELIDELTSIEGSTTTFETRPDVL